MMKFTMVSTVTFMFEDEKIDWDNFDFVGETKKGNITTIPNEVKFVDEDGDEMFDGDENNKIIDIVTNSLNGGA